MATVTETVKGTERSLLPELTLAGKSYMGRRLDLRAGHFLGDIEPLNGSLDVFEPADQVGSIKMDSYPQGLITHISHDGRVASDGKYCLEFSPRFIPLGDYVLSSTFTLDCPNNEEPFDEIYWLDYEKRGVARLSTRVRSDGHRLENWLYRPDQAAIYQNGHFAAILLGGNEILVVGSQDLADEAHIGIIQRFLSGISS